MNSSAKALSDNFSRIRRCCDRGGPQDKLDEHKRTQRPTQKLKARHARTRRDQQVKILRVQTLDVGRRVQTQNAEQARNHSGGRRQRRDGREGAPQCQAANINSSAIQIVADAANQAVTGWLTTTLKPHPIIMTATANVAPLSHRAQSSIRIASIPQDNPLA